MVILGIESSCDETAAAVVADGRKIFSDVIASQIAVHVPYGGVVPELASRKHVEAVLPVVARALSDAELNWDGIDAIAVTTGPGLIGALLVGLSAAKAMAYARGKPLIGVNHLEGHMHAPFVEHGPPEEPFICLVVSGGHTAIYRVEPDGRSRCLGTTRDDAAGEAFDKVAKLLGLGYPGGVIIDRLSTAGNPAAIHFPRAFLDKNSLDFSFSGIKTAVANFVRRFGPPPQAGEMGAYRVEDVAAGFQEAVVDVLVQKTMNACERTGLNRVAVVGGVAANRRLRERIREESEYRRYNLYLPPLRLCTDNAVMIAAAGYSVWRRSGFTPDYLDLDARSRWL